MNITPEAPACLSTFKKQNSDLRFSSTHHPTQLTPKTFSGAKNITLLTFEMGIAYKHRLDNTIVSILAFRYSIFCSKTTRSKGFTVIIDARKGPWKVARTCIRQVNAVLTAEELVQLIVLRPDAFWDKQRVENCTSAQIEKQVSKQLLKY